MKEIKIKELLDAGVHFGHLIHKWNPNMSTYIYKENNGIHLINLYKTISKIEEARKSLKKIILSSGKILFVATKKQAQKIVAEKSKLINMPYVTERWLGGMLTNFVTIRRAIKKMDVIDKMKKDGTYKTLSKKERLQQDRLRAKLEKNLGSIKTITRLPAALFVIDVKKEHIAVKEANKLKIPVFAMVDTNSDPRNINFPIPSNDDASKSIDKILGYIIDAVLEGFKELKEERENKKEIEKNINKVKNAN